MPGDEPDICRLCLTSEGLMLPIFRNFIANNETTFRFKIKSCTSIEIFADDNLPVKVCYVCVHQIEKFFEFQTMCANSESVLRAELKRGFVGNRNRVEMNDSESHDISKLNFHNENKKSISSSTETCDTNKSTFQNRKECDFFTCFICPSSFISSNLLFDHLSTKHSNVESFLCSACECSFSNMNGFKNHVKFEHNLICELCDNVFQHKRNLSDHLKVHTQQNWTCKYCKKVFNNVKQLKNHEFIHIDQTCKFCLKEFSSKIQCQKHSGVCTNKYFCTFCNKEMFLKRDLINHVINFHDSTCSKCKKPDIELKQLDNKEEYYNPNLSKNSTYPVATTLNGKEQNKNLLTCKFCRKKFNLKSSLRRHERSHSEVKLYQCKYCSRHFKDNSTCIVHMRTHTGEHPFQCQECPKDFKQLANLKMHIYRHHRKNCKNDKQCNSAKGQPNSKFEQLCSNEMTEKNKGIDLKFQQNSDCFLNPLNINTQSVNIVRIDQRQ